MVEGIDERTLFSRLDPEAPGAAVLHWVAVTTPHDIGLACLSQRFG